MAYLLVLAFLAPIGLLPGASQSAFAGSAAVQGKQALIVLRHGEDLKTDCLGTSGAHPLGLVGYSSFP